MIIVLVPFNVLYVSHINVCDTAYFTAQFQKNKYILHLIILVSLTLPECYYALLPVTVLYM